MELLYQVLMPTIYEGGNLKVVGQNFQYETAPSSCENQQLTFVKVVDPEAIRICRTRLWNLCNDSLSTRTKH